MALKQIAGSEDFLQAFDVSRETVARLETYEAQLRRWQKAVNLVAPATLTALWHRHFADSAQLAALLPAGGEKIVDVGSGGGFPGLVLAVLLHEISDSRVTLVESDTRKAAFLRETARRMEIFVEILSTRIESNATVKRLNRVDTVTARAFAPLDRLLGLVSPIFSSTTVGVFLKGRTVGREIEEASRAWSFDYDCHHSMTDSGGRIVVVYNLERKPEA